MGYTLTVLMFILNLGKILSRILLLSMPKSDFEGFINLTDGLSKKSSLWSFKVTLGVFGLSTLVRSRSSLNPGYGVGSAST